MQSLALFDSLPATTTHLEQKLDTLLLLGSMLILVKGFTAPEVEVYYNQARALAQRVDNLEQRFLALRGLRDLLGPT